MVATNKPLACRKGFIDYRIGIGVQLKTGAAHPVKERLAPVVVVSGTDQLLLAVEVGNPLVELVAFPEHDASVAEESTVQHCMRIAVAMFAEGIVELLLRGFVQIGIVIDPPKHPFVELLDLVQLALFALLFLHGVDSPRLCLGVEHILSVATEADRDESVWRHSTPFMSVA